MYLTILAISSGDCGVYQHHPDFRFFLGLGPRLRVGVVTPKHGSIFDIPFSSEFKLSYKNNYLLLACLRIKMVPHCLSLECHFWFGGTTNFTKVRDSNYSTSNFHQVHRPGGSSEPKYSRRSRAKNSAPGAETAQAITPEAEFLARLLERLSRLTRTFNSLDLSWW